MTNKLKPEDELNCGAAVILPAVKRPLPYSSTRQR